MAVYKEPKTNTWRVIYRYTDWNGERKQSQKRGFQTKREAQSWEREQLNKLGSDLDMTFRSFVEHTDSVKNKIFSSSIKPSILKHSQEYGVLATLRYVYPDKFDAMTTGEAPDLQDSTNNTGIEVTVAVKEDDMKASRAFSELNHGKPKDIEKRKNIIESSGYSFVPLKDEKVAISTSGTADGEKYFFQQSILRKTH